MDVDTMNAFCRKYDLIYVEPGRVQGMDVYWFIDFQDRRRFYSYGEILDKLGKY